MTEEQAAEALAHLVAARELFGPNGLTGGYVDVGTTTEALDEVIEEAEWTVFRSAGSLVSGPGQVEVRLIRGERLMFREFWERRRPASSG